MIEIDDDDFEDIVGVSGKTLVYFHSTFCPPCKTLGPVLEMLSQEPSDIEFAKINIDNHMLHASRQGVASVPTLVFYEAGYETKRHVGGISAPALRAWLGV